MDERSSRGYTLIEVLVTLGVMVVVLVGLLALLEFNSRVARAQVNVAGMQQSLRVAQAGMVRDLRMAGRGGLPSYRPADPVDPNHYGGMFLPAGAALAVQNNVPANTVLGGSAAVLPGTDVLTIRGVLSTTFYQVNPTGDGTIGNTGTDSLIVRGTSPTGVPQNLQALRDALEGCDGGACPEGLLLVSALNDDIQAVVQLTGGADVPGGVRLDFTTAGTHGEDYLKLSPNGEFPDALTAVAAVGILEEYRYYVRDAAPAPSLARARFYPGTETAYRDTENNLIVDLADNILDLQLALGIDQNNDETITDAGDETDEWLFNDPDDVAGDTALWNAPDRPLYYVRITTLARTDRLDPRYVSPAIDAIEDRVYNEPETPAVGDETLARSYRRRQLTTVVDLRNLS
ncbi:MAG TPA: PilW family protein [Thermoanaerobaculia bacterium]|nr:PilW family protein [Thermoanaerobaculia bacterium]